MQIPKIRLKFYFLKIVLNTQFPQTFISLSYLHFESLSPFMKLEKRRTYKNKPTPNHLIYVIMYYIIDTLVP